jgi:hypothetical protein
MIIDHLEIDPLGKSAKEPGSKLDAGKVPIYRGAISYFPRALRAVAIVSQTGAEKYTWKGWESVEDGENRYTDAMGRHIIDEEIEGLYSKDNLLHKAQRAWNDLASLELFLRNNPDIEIKI